MHCLSTLCGRRSRLGDKSIQTPDELCSSISAAHHDLPCRQTDHRHTTRPQCSSQLTRRFVERSHSAPSDRMKPRLEVRRVAVGSTRATQAIRALRSSRICPHLESHQRAQCRRFLPYIVKMIQLSSRQPTMPLNGRKSVLRLFSID